jgi:hypothetical protein|tara:strand:- start:1359 stop:1487 length:129 start_codon:yes stop_codon:yes gene_type:complete
MLLLLMKELVSISAPFSPTRITSLAYRFSTDSYLIIAPELTK